MDESKPKTVFIVPSDVFPKFVEQNLTGGDQCAGCIRVHLDHGSALGCMKVHYTSIMGEHLVAQECFVVMRVRRGA